MDRIIPILPCQSIKEQVEFYTHLGFETVKIFTRPNAYVVMKYGTLEIHFYGDKRIVPSENANMCCLRVDDVDNIYEMVTRGLKKNTGKIPRSGIPRISKLKDLTGERRFIITDVSGNTLFVGTESTKLSFFRSIESKEYAKQFELLYDLIYSKEDSNTAYSMLIKHFPTDIDSLNIGELDLAKVLLVALDIHLQRNKIVDKKINDKLQDLFNASQIQNSDWERILQKYNDIVNIE